MATKSPEHGSAFDSDAWKDIVELAGQLDSDVASGRSIDRQLALHLARAIISLEEAYPCSQTASRVATKPRDA